MVADTGEVRSCEGDGEGPSAKVAAHDLDRQRKSNITHAFYFPHPLLGHIRGCRLGNDIVQFRGIPYASIQQRFAVSTILQSLSGHIKDGQSSFDATDYGPISIQPLDSFATDVRWNQFPPEAVDRHEAQSEDCLRIILTVPTRALETASGGLPILAFIHGGALRLASGDREYYDPIQLCRDAIESGKPMIFAAINYRLNALEFMHSPEASELLPANNGLHDQIHAFEWIRNFISGFGGDQRMITAIGQSAGAVSLSLHSSRPSTIALYRRAVILSGSSVVLVTMTPKEHQAEFIQQAQKLGIATEGRTSSAIAQDFIDLPLAKIREIDMPAAPCSGTTLIPDLSWATMGHARHAAPNAWLEGQVLGSCTYDGSISHLVALQQTRRNLAKVFIAICRSRLKYSAALLNIYDISPTDSDAEAIVKICHIVTDAGYFNAAGCHALGAQAHATTYMQLFDVGNPFRGDLDSGKFATHTWDIVALLGAYDHLVPEPDLRAVKEWRGAVISYVHNGDWPCQPWTPDVLATLHIHAGGIFRLGEDEVRRMRARKLMDLVEREGGDGGADFLWEEVVRFFLKTGDPRYAHEAESILEDVQRDEL